MGTNAPEIDGVLKADGSVPMTGSLDLNGNKIVNVGEPIEATDGVNKDYVDKEIEKKSHQFTNLLVLLNLPNYLLQLLIFLAMYTM